MFMSVDRFTSDYPNICGADIIKCGGEQSEAC